MNARQQTSRRRGAISRRQFLMRSGVGIGAIGLGWPAAWAAADKNVPEFRFIVISDTHLGMSNSEQAAQRWRRTAAELAEAPGDFVLHLGDIVDGGREEQYAIYKEARDKIGKPVYEIPGNHDLEALFTKHIRADVDTSFDHKGVRFVLLNDAPRDNIHDHLGHLTDDQLAWLETQCEDAAQQQLLVILCMHVAAHNNLHPDVGWWVKVGQGQRRFYALLEKHAGRVLATFHGHFHCGLRGWDDHWGVDEIVFPSALYNNNRKIEGNAPGYNLPDVRPGYVLAEIGAHGMMLRYKPLGHESEASRNHPF